MKKFLTLGLSGLLAVSLLTGCGATSPFTYHVKPTPLKNSETKYSLGNIDVNLTLGHGAIAGDKTFASDSQLKKQFTQYIKKHLQEKGLLAKSKTSASARIDVVVNYKLIKNTEDHESLEDENYSWLGFDRSQSIGKSSGRDGKRI